MNVEIMPPEAATEAALVEIAELLSSVFLKPRDWLRDLRWQYLDNPNGPAWFVNARDANGKLVGHYGVASLPSIADDRFARARCFLSLNTAVHPSAQGKGLFKSTAQRLFDHLQSIGETVILGVANANSAPGFTRSLGFYHLGQLDLRMHPPFVMPRSTVPRALRTDEAHLRWRIARPGLAPSVAGPKRDALVVRIQHKGLPIDNVLTTGLDPAMLRAAGAAPLSAAKRLVPAGRLYASFGGGAAHGMPVPDRLRPSPLHYICRPLPDTNAAPLINHLASRRLEFFDFDVT